MPQLGGVLLAWDISKIKLKSPGYPPFKPEVIIKVSIVYSLFKPEVFMKVSIVYSSYKPEVIIKVSIVLIDEPTGWNVSPLCPWHWINCWGFKGPVRAGAGRCFLHLEAFWGSTLGALTDSIVLYHICSVPK